MSHHIRLQPNTHGVIRTQHVRITYTMYTLHFRNQVNLRVILQKLRVITIVLGKYRKYQQHRVLALLGSHTNLRYLGRQQTLSHRHTVLHVDSRHIRVCSLRKINGNFRGTVIRGGRTHVHHVLNTIDLILQRRNHTIQYGLRVSTRISGSHRYGWRGDIRILGNRQGNQA